MWLDEVCRVYTERKKEGAIFSTVTVVSWEGESVEDSKKPTVDFIVGPQAAMAADSFVLASHSLDTLASFIDQNEDWKKHENGQKVLHAYQLMKQVIESLKYDMTSVLHQEVQPKKKKK